VPPNVNVAPPNQGTDAPKRVEERAAPQPVAQTEDARAVDALVAKYAAPARQDRYDAALNEAAAFIAEKKYARALVALEDARALDDNDQVRREIDKARDLIAQQGAVEHTASDARVILADGKPEDAGRILTGALKNFGGSDGAEELAGLKRQADTLTAVALSGDPERRDRFGREAKAALVDNNLRAASLALEQALLAGADPELKRQSDEVNDRLARYDEARRRAAELRREPARLEEAITSLQDARQAWDTVQVRQEIDECTLALQRRRDRIGVADFELRGDVGLPAAGRTIAEELLPAFRSRFDIVEHGQLNRVLGEMQLEAGELNVSDRGQQELGRIARVRYLVFGSVFPLNGVTINARLVEVGSGLVVQTARLTGPSIESLLPRLPQLGQMLMMNDEQKLAFEQALAQQAQSVQPAPLEAAYPPVPTVSDPVPPPLVVYTARPPAVGGLVIEDFGRLPPVAYLPAPPPAPVVVVEDDPYRRRLLSISLELGDNLFRRGRHREAFVHFELALGLSNGHRDVALRVERCKPYLPPAAPPVVVVQPQLVVVAPPMVIGPRPRLVVFNFLVNCEPGLVPPACGDWAADHFVSYCGASYDVVERGEVCWYMGRLNITMKDVLYNPAARCALAQALHVRYFVFGTIQQTASLNVEAHLFDAETGSRTGTGMIHVQDHNELKLRMQELVRQTAAGKQEQAQLAKTGAASEKALTEARKQLAAGDAAGAATTARAGLQNAPGSVALLALAQQADEKKKQADLEAAHRAAAKRAQAEADAIRKQRQELTKQAEALRVKALAEAKAQDEATRRAAAQQKQQAADRLRAEASAAAKKGDYAQAVRTLQSAAALKSDAGTMHELAQVKAKADEAARQRAAAETAQQVAEAKRLAEAAAAKVAEERRRRDADEAERRKAQETRDRAEQGRLVAVAREALAKGQFDAARAALDSARLLKATDDVAKLAKDVQDARARAEAKVKGAAAQGETERRLAEEKARAEKAEAEARQKQTAYTNLLKQAQQALAEKRYDQAAAAYQDAGKLFRTDAVLTGLRQVDEARDRNRQAADAAKKRQADLEAAISAGQDALKKNNSQGAVNAFKEALRIVPDSREATAGLQEANRRLVAATAAQQADAKARQEEARRQGEFKRLMKVGGQAIALKKYDEAVQAYTEALRLQPNDPTATAALRQATRARTQPPMPPRTDPKLDPMNPPKLDPPTPPKANPKAEARAEYNRFMQSGEKLERAQKTNEAIQAYRQALKLIPEDAAALAALRRTDLPLQLAAGKQALAARRFPEAIRAFEAALQLAPNNAEARAGLQKARKGTP
jgi:tetratricopeptide (TPR) repeat protein